MTVASSRFLSRRRTDDGVLIVTLDRPPVNAVTLSMFRELSRLVASADDEGIRGIVITAEGPHFCAGGDLRELQSAATPEEVDAQQQTIREAYWSILRSAVPVVAAVRGMAAGAGAAIAAVCDVIICSPEARFVMPEVSVGMVGGSAHLQRILPHQVVRWMSLSGEPVGAERLRELGAVLDVVNVDELDARAIQACQDMTRHAGDTLSLTKRALNVVTGCDLENGYRYEQQLSIELTGLRQ